MTIASIQPCFVPWAGYFEQIAVADVFVYLDDVQYTKKDWRNTNRMKSPAGVRPLHVPVRKTSRETRLNEALISYNEAWQAALINKMTEWYRPAPYFAEVMPLVEGTVAAKHERLIDLTCDLNQALLDYMDVTTPIRRSSTIPRTVHDKNGRILEICRHFEGVDCLYDGKSAEDFIDQERFRSEGIEVVFQDYRPAAYPQLWGGAFEPNLSIVDLLMNCGKGAKNVILSSPLPDRLKTYLT